MLEALSGTQGLTVSELMGLTKLPKQTAHRILQQLQHAGLVVKYPNDKRFFLGRRLEQFAVRALMGGASQRERHAILRSLVADVEETCNLTSLAGLDIVYLDRVEADWPLRVILSPGSHVPLHATASGKLLLAMLPREQRERLIGLLPMRALTPHTLTSSARLREELVGIRRERLSLNRGEHLHGLIAVAVPVMLSRSRACAAVALQAPVGRRTLDDLLRLVPRMRQAATQLAQTFPETERQT
jgi:DNA-binding IclR family transcriptional regulator